MREPVSNRVAFAGYSRTGKSTACNALVTMGCWRKRAFSTGIKEDLDLLCLTHFGFSAFTEVDSEKDRVRRTFEAYGLDNYADLSARLFKRIDNDILRGWGVANDRLCRPQEAEEWKAHGGIIINLARPGVGPKTPAEQEWMTELEEGGFIDHTLYNCGDLAELRDAVRGIVYGHIKLNNPAITWSRKPVGFEAAEAGEPSEVFNHQDDSARYMTVGVKGRPASPAPPEVDDIMLVRRITETIRDSSGFELPISVLKEMTKDEIVGIAGEIASLSVRQGFLFEELAELDQKDRAETANPVLVGHIQSPLVGTARKRNGQTTSG